MSQSSRTKLPAAARSECMISFLGADCTVADSDGSLALTYSEDKSLIIVAAATVEEAAGMVVMVGMVGIG
jgi:hypothetical protein